MPIYTVKLGYYRVTWGPKPNHCEFASTAEAPDWRAALDSCIQYLHEKLGSELNFESIHVERVRRDEEIV